MDIFTRAKKIVTLLEKNRFEAYIVGGAVRDYLLKNKLNDVDITTSAYPTQVMKLFKTKPTGLKYGTVTVFFEDETFEVTTFRKDGPSQDSRHPDSVIYSGNVLDDVNRRDFTMNALLMDARGKIHDHVGGKSDIRNKLIRAIGNPAERFEEDALRILRALYFQAKLGFEIDEKTQQAMKEKRFLIANLANERILQELLKLLKGPYALKTMRTMVSLEIDQVLPGLSKGIIKTAQLEQMPFIDSFFTLCFVLNDGVIPSEWTFSNKHRIYYAQASLVALKYPVITERILYQYGLDICLLSHKVNYFLGKNTLAEKKIIAMYESLPVKSEIDLKISSDDMMKLLNKKPGAWMSKAKEAMVYAVLDKRITNDQRSLESFLQSMYEVIK